jgi:hypothetical protein
MKRSRILRAQIQDALKKAKEHIDGGGHVHADGSEYLLRDCPVCHPKYAAVLTLHRKREILN